MGAPMKPEHNGAMGRQIFALISWCALAASSWSCSGSSEGCANATDCARGEMCVSGQCLSALPKNDDASTDQDAFVFPDAVVDLDLGVAADVDKFPDASTPVDLGFGDAPAA